ncbi:MAG TPA: hypothetical protein VG738_23105 [Chitinophagaceae bacterium]|nr:hypothetical protein [Chitinophagaceae bacterium]
MNKIFFFCGLLLCKVFTAGCQVSVTGATCVIPGITYQYIISTPDTSGTGIHFCASGGVFNNGDSCLNDSLFSAVLVTWSNNVKTATLTFNSPSGSYTETISITSALTGGFIDAAFLQQTITTDSAISHITCSSPTGGACSPSYVYQWQQSANNVDWTDIAGATGQDFDQSLTITQTTYLRRRVTETVSTAVGYSSVAAVYTTLTSNP